MVSKSPRKRAIGKLQLYRAWVTPIYNGRWLESKKRWEYTQATSPEQAGHNLRQRFPFPSWHVEPVILDLRSPNVLTRGVGS